MMLGRDEILKLAKEKNMLEGYDESCLQGAGYDLRVGKFYNCSGDSYLGKDERRMPRIEEIPSDILQMAPGDYVLIETVEKVNMPADIAARVLNRSSVFRCGATTFNALVDPGYQGTLTFGLKNVSNSSFSIQRGARVAQIVFEEVKGRTESYSGKYQGGKVV